MKSYRITVTVSLLERLSVIIITGRLTISADGYRQVPLTLIQIPHIQISLPADGRAGLTRQECLKNTLLVVTYIHYKDGLTPTGIATG